MENLCASLVFIVWDVTFEEVVKVFDSETKAIEYIAFHPKENLSYSSFPIE